MHVRLSEKITCFEYISLFFLEAETSSARNGWAISLLNHVSFVLLLHSIGFWKLVVFPISSLNQIIRKDYVNRLVKDQESTKQIFLLTNESTCGRSDLTNSLVKILHRLLFYEIREIVNLNFINFRTWNV